MKAENIRHHNKGDFCYSPETPNKSNGYIFTTVTLYQHLTRSPFWLPKHHPRSQQSHRSRFVVKEASNYWSYDNHFSLSDLSIIGLRA